MASPPRPEAAPFAVEAEGAVLAYGERRALDGFSVAVPAGAVFGLLGPNGSGKSSFIALAAAAVRPPVGSLRLFGLEPAPPLRRRIGTVFQENASDPLMTVGETLALAGRLFGLGGEARREASRRLISAFGLAGREHSAVATLSGGMRRRLEMARALLHGPELLLLDEPTTGVDPGERQAAWEAILRPGGRPRTILLATNDLAEAEAVCDQVAFVSEGRVIATGTPASLVSGLRRESVRIEWQGLPPAALTEVAALPGAGAIATSGTETRITVDDAAAFVPRLFALAPGAVRSVRIERATLEDAYFQHVARRAAP